MLKRKHSRRGSEPRIPTAHSDADAKNHEHGIEPHWKSEASYVSTGFQIVRDFTDRQTGDDRTEEKADGRELLLSRC